MNLLNIFPLHVIKRDDGAPYLKRWTLLNLYFIKIRLHHILLSDYDCMHDHPWWFITWIIKGGYFEREPIGQYYKYDTVAWENMRYISSWRSPGSILYRPATFRHSLYLPETKGVLQTAWTLVIMGRKKRLWGFWSKKLGFIPWFNYHSSQKCD